ncbi:Predicted arabinose efflux permease, MFS family [Lentzea xinjiangensis]|uniref:Predicted arabinose efflux permease, MFS family n=1 Tax=Lentzea xinjiangensis TaxID=402600 RepID=A0A1H9W3S9_9PSEU|nr:MFS transporter [Lentzea xinjiangensis]SES28153.1 Predicted arabinose efflux permease, MFS family [Lentzea xinjiangensis]
MRSPAAALTALSLSMLLPSLGISIATVALPTLSSAFGASFPAVQWVVIAYLLTTTALVVVMGRLGDLFGRRRLLVGGAAVFTAATLLCGLAPSLPLLVAGRALQGVGAACMMALTVAFVGETVPKDRTGSAMGLLGTMSAIGTATGPALGGLLIAVSGWRAIFLAVVPLGVVAVVLAHRVLPAPPPRPASGRTGAALREVLRDKGLATGLSTSALVSAVMMTTLVVGPFHLSGVLGLTPVLVGAVMSAGPAVSALTGVPAGRATDRFGTRAMVVAGLTGIAGGALVLAFLPPAAGVAGYVLPLVVITASYAVFQAANNTGVMKDVPARDRGLVSGMLTLSRNLGLMSGASLMGAIFTRAAGTGDVTAAAAEQVARGTRWTFVVAAGLVAVGLAAVLRSRSRVPVA